MKKLGWLIYVLMCVLLCCIIMLLNLSLMYALIVVVEFNLIKGSFFQFSIVLHAMFVSSLFHFVMIFSIVSSSLE